MAARPRRGQPRLIADEQARPPRKPAHERHPRPACGLSLGLGPPAPQLTTLARYAVLSGLGCTVAGVKGQSRRVATACRLRLVPPFAHGASPAPMA
jgi:hypothetical protein